VANLILRSGYLDDYNALGENGQTIFESAIQIRETLRLRKQLILLDCLAIPQHNEAEDKVDWYAPHEGVITQWANASGKQREHALRYLENCLTSASVLSKSCLLAEKTSVRLFGSLLARVMQFPASQHVYLVDDKPVITFWGFTRLNHAQQDDPLDCLREIATPVVAEIAAEQEPVIPPVAEKPDTVTPETPPPLVEKSLINKPLVIEASDPLPATAPEPEDEKFADPQPVVVTLSSPSAPPSAPPSEPAVTVQAEPAALPQKTRLLWRSLMLKIAFVGILFIGLPVAWPYIAAMMPSLVVTPYRAGSTENNVPANIAEPVTETPKILVATQLPVQPAVVVAPPAPAVKEDSLKEPVVEKAQEPFIDKNALVLPADEVKAGSTAFMNGRWKASINVNNPLTSTPPGLRYQIKNSEGTISITRNNNIVCKADVYLGLMQSGNLLIKSRTKAKCSDDTRYQVPEITCKQPLSGAAQCTGRYEDNTVVPMTLLRVGK